MGMSIDESIEVIKHEKPEKPTSMYGIMKKNAFNTAIDTMRKYQKIAELYDYWRSSNYEYTISCMENIGKVLKDGKID